MKRLNCIIVDDEPLALDILEGYVRNTPSLELVGRFSSATDALALVAVRGGGDGRRGIDLAFLDIQMPGMNGLDLAKAIGGESFGADTRMIFTTAFPQYALEGFRVDALDYLLKPVSFAEFTRAVEKAVEWFGIKRAADASGDGVGAADPSLPRTLIVRSDYKQFLIPIDTIVYIEGIRDYIRIHTVNAAGGAASVQTLMNLKTVEDMLPVDRFARVHRSYIVNLGRIKRIERGRIVFDGIDGGGDEASVPVSDTYREAFMKVLAARSL